jgi:two-component system sensor histidine kinase VicK
MDKISLLMFEMLEHDARVCFAFDLSSRTLLYVNNAFKSFFNSDHSYFSLYHLLTYIDKDDRKRLLIRLLQMKAGDSLHDIEVRVIMSEQNRYWIKLNLHLNARSIRPILTGYFEDISAYKAENRRLSEYASSRNAISNILAHDLAGPLGNIQMFSNFIKQELSSSDSSDIQELVEDIEEISKQSLNLIRNYVDGEYLETGRKEITRKLTELVQPLSKIIESYRQSSSSAHLDISFSSSHREIYVLVDELKFLQAIGNLMSNAVKFTPNGGKIHLEIIKKPNAVLIRLQDTGIGIAKKYHSTLFEKFNGARRPGLKGQPTVGLGMSVIKTIIDWHEGSIWLDSEENVGTTFFVELST